MTKGLSTRWFGNHLVVGALEGIIYPTTRKNPMRQKIVSIIALLCFVILASGCEPTVNKEVLIFGDSVMFSAVDDVVYHSNYVRDDYTGRYAPNFGSVNGGQGLTFVKEVQPANVDAFWRAHVASLMEHTQPEVIVVELGVNDCSNRTGWHGRVDNFMQNIPSTIPVHWLTIPDPLGDLGLCDSSFNKALAEATLRWPNLELFAWSEKGNSNPSWFHTDGIHLTTAGQDGFAKWLTGQLDIAYPPPNNPTISQQRSPN